MLLQWLLWLYIAGQHPYASAMCLKVRLLTGTPWTEQEHRAFLAGLEKLGKVLDYAERSIFCIPLAEIQF